MQAPLVIVGTGLAGYTLAREYRRLDADRAIVMLTQDDGAYYSKPLLSTALAKGQTAEQLAMKTAPQMAQQLNLDIKTHTQVEQLDCVNQCVKTSAGDLEYSHCVLAMGAKPIDIPLAGDAVKQMVSVNNLTDYAQFRQWLCGKKHIAILGSGLVGCEFMNDLLLSDYRVTVVSIDDYPLQRLLPLAELGHACQQEYADRGVTWHLQQAAQSVDQRNGKMVITLSDGATVEADGVISAVGLRADTALAKQAKLTVNQGIVVDDYARTSDPNVFALGDCAEIFGHLYQYVAPILHAARACAKTLSGTPTAIVYPPMPVVVKTTACPVVSLLPQRIPPQAQWSVAGDAPHAHAELVDETGVHGFVLMGDSTAERMQWLKKISI
jgi:rubredoxin---NAD+ reductase